MKKNRGIALALAGALLIGGTFAGTKAIFQSEDKMSQNIKVTMGKLEVDLMYPPMDWRLDQGDGSNAEFSSTDLEVVLNNAKPGDKLKRYVSVQNLGSLNLDATVSLTDAVKDIDGLKVTLTNPGWDADNASKVVEVKENVYNIENLRRKTNVGDGAGGPFVDFEITIEVTDEMQGDIIEFSAEEFITVNATQR